MFEEMQKQLSHLESELAHSKAKREQQAREFARERREVRQRAEAEQETAKQRHEEQVAQLNSGHQMELEAQLRDAEGKRVRYSLY